MSRWFSERSFAYWLQCNAGIRSTQAAEVASAVFAGREYAQLGKLLANLVLRFANTHWTDRVRNAALMRSL